MNVTVSIDDALLARARDLARARGMSLQALLREQLERLVGTPAPDELVAELRARWRDSGTIAGAPRMDRGAFYDDLLDRDGRRG